MTYLLEGSHRIATCISFLCAPSTQLNHARLNALATFYDEDFGRQGGACCH